VHEASRGTLATGPSTRERPSRSKWSKVTISGPKMTHDHMTKRGHFLTKSDLENHLLKYDTF